jgi:transcription elongation factor GreA
MENKYKMTHEGLEELKQELKQRLGKDRDEIAEEIKAAREQGDLSENSAYKAAMDKKEFNEKRIVEIENMIKNAVVITEDTSSSKVGVGKKVKVHNKTDKVKLLVELVGPSEADPASKKISIESPLGIALLGRKKGDEFKFQTPAGEHIYVVEDIN